MDKFKLKEVDLHVTNRCNRRCVYCSYQSGEKILEELTFSKISLLINEISELKCNDVHLTGGEPLLRKDIFKIIELLIDKNISVRLQTNGFNVPESTLEKLWDTGLRSMMISLDSSYEQINDNLRGKGSHYYANRFIKQALSIGFDLRVNAVLCKTNVDFFPDLVEYLANMGIRCISAFYFSPIGRGKNLFSEWLDPLEYLEKYSKIKGQIKQLISQKKINIDVILEPGYFFWDDKINFDVSLFGGCGGGCANLVKRREYLIIRCDGEVYPCSLILDSKKGLGNINSKPLSKIISDDLNWNNLLLSSKQANANCAKCLKWEICGGGCTGYINNVNFDETGKDPRCQYGSLFPVCPIMKSNISVESFGGSSDEVQRELG